MKYWLCMTWLWLNRGIDAFVYGVAAAVTGLVAIATLGNVLLSLEIRAIRWILTQRDWMLDYDCEEQRKERQ